MKTRKSYRKLIAILLSIVTIIGCFSVTAFADEVETPPEEPVAIDSIVQVPSHETNFGIGGGGIAKNNIPVYYDINLTGSYQVGTILYGEGFTIIANDTDVSPYHCIKVEYNTSSGAQQGYISSSEQFDVSTNAYNNLAHVNVSSASVYYGAEPGYYPSFGTVYYGEFVNVLGISSTYGRAFIEYNAANGQRKRGYVDRNALYYFGTINNNNPNNTPFDYSGYDHLEIVGQPVYSGPSTTYPSIGSINDNEAVRVKIDNLPYYFNNHYWKYITYSIGNGQYKAGYIMDIN